jgi:ABC-2 type transport system ATP-binding protein
MSELLECRGLRKSFGGKTALDGVDLTVGRGKIVGLLGPNGSGKTTLMKIANGLLCPTGGELTINGAKPGPETKKIVSYLPDADYLPDWMTVTQLVNMFGDFYSDFSREKADGMLKTLSIDGKERLKTLSKGTKEKVQLILAMSREAQLYMLDEPIGGVDPAARDYILNTIIGNYSENASVMISTHLIADIEPVLDEAVFINRGRIVLHKSVDDIRTENGKSVDEVFREVFRCLEN